MSKGGVAVELWGVRKRLRHHTMVIPYVHCRDAGKSFPHWLVRGVPFAVTNSYQLTVVQTDLTSIIPVVHEIPGSTSVYASI
jgi:hypothetical protein